MVKMACERELWAFIAVAPTTPVTRNKMECVQLALRTSANKNGKNLVYSISHPGQGSASYTDFSMFPSIHPSIHPSKCLK
jgi:hypothetical protein